MTCRIICVGNRYVRGDDLGPRVHARLAARPLPPGTELVDGGLRGLDLLPLVAGPDRLVFVDALEGFGEPGEVAVLDGLAAAERVPAAYGHAGGLAYLLRVLPAVWAGPGPLPEIRVVGAAGPVDDEVLERIVGACLEQAGRPAAAPTARD